MRFARMVGILVVMTLGLVAVAMGLYTAYVARMWARAMQS